MQEGHFQISPVGRDVENENKGNFGIVLAIVCGGIVGIILASKLPILEGGTDLLGTTKGNQYNVENNSSTRMTYRHQYDIFPDIFGHILLALEQILAMKMVLHYPIPSNRIGLFSF